MFVISISLYKKIKKRQTGNGEKKKILAPPRSDCKISYVCYHDCWIIINLAKINKQTISSEQAVKQIKATPTCTPPRIQSEEGTQTSDSPVDLIVTHLHGRHLDMLVAVCS